MQERIGCAAGRCASQECSGIQCPPPHPELQPAVGAVLVSHVADTCEPVVLAVLHGLTGVACRLRADRGAGVSCQRRFTFGAQGPRREDARWFVWCLVRARALQRRPPIKRLLNHQHPYAYASNCFIPAASAALQADGMANKRHWGQLMCPWKMSGVPLKEPTMGCPL